MQKITSLRYRVLPRLPGANPGIFITEEGGGGAPNFGSESAVELFVVNYFSQRRPRVFQSVNAGRRWCRK